MKTSTAFARWALIVLALALPSALWASVGKVVIAAGDVYAVNTDNEQRPLRRRSDVFEGDTLITGADGKLQLRFNDNAIMALRADSELVISEYQGASEGTDEQVLMDLLAGGFRTITGSIGSTDRDAYRVRTPNASIGIRGTHYEAVYQSETLTVGVYDGGITVSNDQGSIDLGLDSEFLYAQVQAGNFPEGLLNPPDNLNQPNTPETGEGGDSDDETENEGENDGNNEEEDDGISLDDWNGDTDDPPPIPDSDEISEDDFNFSELEDALEEELNNDGWLTDAERTALAENSQSGFLVFGSGAFSSDGENAEETETTVSSSSGSSIFTYSASVDGENPFYAGYQTIELAEENGEMVASITPLSSYDPATDDPHSLTRLDVEMTQTVLAEHDLGGGNTVEWGIWNADPNNPATGYSNPELEYETDVDIIEPFFYVNAEPANPAQLEGEVTFSLAMDGLTQECFTHTPCLSTPTDQPLTANSGYGSAGGTLTAYFNTGAADGSLFFYTEDPDDATNTHYWSLEYSGMVEGAQFVGTINSELSDVTNDLENSSMVSGTVNGLFVETGNLPGFVGGFNAETIPEQPFDADINGVFILEEQPQ